MSFKTIRIVLLLILLVLIVHHQATDKARFASWETPVFVAVYPVNADGSEQATRYIRRLDEDAFAAIERFVYEEASRYAVELHRPMYIELGEPIPESPPPAPVGGSFLQRATWILKVRWWRWRFDDQGMDPDVIVLARYHDPEGRRRLPHSTGVERIRVAIANLFATRAMQSQNQVVMIHEILHTLGATDKYDLGTGQPAFPDGFAEPDRTPLYPQRIAEIMAGRIPVAANEARPGPSRGRGVGGPRHPPEIGGRRAAAC
ncbi:MAG: hypothetical protein ACNS61_09625, partial [Candidatus Wenzhouxiangella sp. M2_3B_020]